MLNQTANPEKMRSSKRTRRRWRSGSTVLDAALVLPILLLFAFGTVEYAYYFYVQHTLQGAAREGVRAGITPGATNTDVNNAVAAMINAASLSDSGYAITTTPSNIADAATGAQITVKVECSWEKVGLRPLGLIPTTKAVRGIVVMRKEGS